jgi:phosphoenolpyruvate carboxylase
MEDCSDDLRQKVGNEREPYRAILGDLKANLIKTHDGIEAYLQGQTSNIVVGIENQVDLTEPLELCYHSLLSQGMSGIANSLLLDTIRRAYCFGINLLKLDSPRL